MPAGVGRAISHGSTQLHVTLPGKVCFPGGGVCFGESQAAACVRGGEGGTRNLDRRRPGRMAARVSRSPADAVRVAGGAGRGAADPARPAGNRRGTVAYARPGAGPPGRVADERAFDRRTATGDRSHGNAGIGRASAELSRRERCASAPVPWVPVVGLPGERGECTCHVIWGWYAGRSHWVAGRARFRLRRSR